MKALDDLWNFLRNIAVRDASRQTYVVLPDAKRTIPLIKPNEHYFRLRVTDMYLAQDRQWFTQLHPAVTAQIRLRFANQDHTPVCRVAAPPQGKTGAGIYRNYSLTDLLPYNGGEVSFQADLIAMQGDNAFALAFKLLEGFSGLVGAPLAPALAIAEQLATGLNRLLEKQPAMRLGFHQAFTPNGGASFEPGYHVVVLADTGTLRADGFSIVNDVLNYSPKNGAPAKPLEGYDYAVFRIEAAETRDDWRFPEVDAHIRNAKQALLEPDPTDSADNIAEKSKRHRNAAIMAIHASPDLVMADRRRIVEAIKAELKEVATDLKLAPSAKPRSLEEIIAARARKPALAAGDGEMTTAEALGD